MLDPSIDAFWIGRVWTAAYDYWRNRGLGAKERVWEGHRVCILGRGNGKGGGMVVARTVLCQVLRAGGGQIVKEGDNETFAIVEGGVSKEDAAALMQRGVLCLGVGFVVEVVVRGRGHPREYLLFEEQRALCGEKIETGVGRVEVTKVQLQGVDSVTGKSGQTLESNKQKNCEMCENVKQISPSCRVKIRLKAQAKRSEKGAGGLDARERTKGRDAHMEGQRPTDMVQERSRRILAEDREESYLVKDTIQREDKLHSPISVDALDDERQTAPGILAFEKMSVTKPISAKPSLFSKETIDLTEKAVLLSTLATPSETVTPKQRRSTSQGSIQSSSSEEVGVKTRRKRKRMRKCKDAVKSQLQFHSPQKIDVEIMDIDKEPVLRYNGEGGNGALSSRPEVLCIELDSDNEERDETSTRVPCSGQTRERRVHSQPHRFVECSTSTRTAQRPVESWRASTTCSLTMSEMDNISEFQRFGAPCDSLPLLQSKRIHTVEDGSNFMLELLGGQPPDNVVAEFLLPLRSARTNHDLFESDSEKSSSEKLQECSSLGAQMNAEEDSPAIVEDEPMPPAEEADDISFGLPVSEDGLQGHSAMRSRKNRSIQSQLLSDRSGRTAQLQPSVDLFEMPAPKEPILLEKILLPEFASFQHAGDISIVNGNTADDDACQNEIKFFEWILGAERFVGVSPSWLSQQEAGKMDAMAMRITLALVESRVICQFGMPGSRSNSELTVLVGICTRLVSAPTTYDPSFTLVTELLSLRDKQIQAGFDSLQMVFSSNNLLFVPQRHQAIAFLWSIIVYQVARSADRTDLLTLFNKVCATRLASEPSKSTVTSISTTQALKNELHWVLSAAITVGRVFALRVDFMEDSNHVCDSVRKELCPENWNIVCQCLEYFYGDTISLVGKVSASKEILHSFLSKIAVHVAGRLWNVTEEILTAVSRAISSLGRANNENCCCKVQSLFVAQFNRLGDVNSNRAGLGEHLRTPCDCYFFLGWLFCTYGAGNAMKRALGVIKNGSSFTSLSPSSNHYLRAINHHIGLTLTVADSLASANQNGEYLLCRTLTSKCTGLETVANKVADCGRKDDQCWRATVMAIAVRCRLLIARSQSVQDYSNWLFQNVIGAFRVARKSNERCALTAIEREKRRVLESISGNLVLLALNTLREIMDSVHSKALEGGDDARNMVECFVKGSESYTSGFTKYGNIIVSQMRINVGEGINREKGELLDAMLNVIANEIKLLRLVSSKTQGKGERTKVNCKIQSALDHKLETLIVAVIVTDILNEDVELAAKLKRSAARGLAELLELIKLSRKLRNEEEKRQIEASVSRALSDGAVVQLRQNCRVESVEQEMEWRRIRSEVEIEFWSVAVSRSWTRELIGSGSPLESMMVKAIIVGMGYALDSRGGDNNREMIWKLIRGVAGVRRLEWILHEQQDEVDGDEKGNLEVRWLKTTTRKALDLYTIRQTLAILNSLDRVMVDLINHSSQAKTLCSALLIHADIFLLTSHASTFLSAIARNHSVRLQPWLEPLTCAVQKLQFRNWQGRRDEVDYTLKAVQRRLVSGLGTTAPASRDLENQVCVMRVIKALAQGDTALDGLWEGPVWPTGGGIQGEELKRYERQVVGWQKIAFDVAIDVPLCRVEFSGSFVELRHLVERFLAAVRVFTQSMSSERREALVWQAKQTYRRACQGKMMCQGQVAAPEMWMRIEQLLNGE